MMRGDQYEAVRMDRLELSLRVLSRRRTTIWTSRGSSAVFDLALAGGFERLSSRSKVKRWLSESLMVVCGLSQRLAADVAMSGLEGCTDDLWYLPSLDQVLTQQCLTDIRNGALRYDAALGLFVPTQRRTVRLVKMRERQQRFEAAIAESAESEAA